MNRPCDPVIAGAAGAATFVAIFGLVCWAGSKLLGHIDRIEERWFREQEARG